MRRSLLIGLRPKEAKPLLLTDLCFLLGKKHRITQIYAFCLAKSIDLGQILVAARETTGVRQEGRDRGPPGGGLRAATGADRDHDPHRRTPLVDVRVLLLRRRASTPEVR